MTPDELVASLRDKGIVRSESATVRALEGGVSSDIILIDDAGRRLVVKQALAKLRVKDDWFADTARNYFEQEYMRYAGAVVPGCVPRILHSGDGFFVMEYLGDGWVNWKSELLAGRIDGVWARAAGRVLAAIHRASWNDGALRREFATTANFYKLRIESYLITTGKRNPPLQAHFDAEAARLEATSLALVHGDFSPKNILLHAANGRIAVLDCEVAWFGDPMFDVAFLLNHFLLKALRRQELRADYLGLVTAFLETYGRELGGAWSSDCEERATRLLLMLLLARVDGKSPVEYLAGDTGKQQFIRDFAAENLPRCPATVADLAALWQSALAAL